MGNAELAVAGWRRERVMSYASKIKLLSDGDDGDEGFGRRRDRERAYRAPGRSVLPFWIPLRDPRPTGGIYPTYAKGITFFFNSARS